MEAASDAVERKKEEDMRKMEQELHFKECYKLMQQMLKDGLNVVEVEQGYVDRSLNEGLHWVSSVYKVFDNEGNEVREATRNEIGMTEFIACNIRGHKLFYEHHEDGMSINMKNMIEWYEKYK